MRVGRPGKHLENPREGRGRLNRGPGKERPQLAYEGMAAAAWLGFVALRALRNVASVPGFLSHRCLALFRFLRVFPFRPRVFFASPAGMAAAAACRPH
jgi:hypothetical protein